MRSFLERFTSRKFLMAVAVFIAGGLKAVFPDFPDEALKVIAAAGLGYIAVEGVVDAVALLVKWFVEKKKQSSEQGSPVCFNGSLSEKPALEKE